MSASTWIVTGASRGIGRATALAAAAEGAHVLPWARNADALETLRHTIEQQGGHCTPMTVDVASPQAVHDAVQRIDKEHGRIDALINNAGTAPLGKVEKLPLEAFQTLVDVNVRGLFHTIHAVWPVMIAQGGGRIVNISSLAATDPFPGFQVYGASKAWAEALTRSLANEGRPHAIQVFAVAPGAVETDLLRAHFPDFPAEQCLSADDVAQTILWLLNPQSRYASGTIVPVQR